MKPRKKWAWCSGGDELLNIEDVYSDEELNGLRIKARKTRCKVCNRRLMPSIRFPSLIINDIVCVRIPPHKSRK